MPNVISSEYNSTRALNLNLVQVKGFDLKSSSCVPVARKLSWQLRPLRTNTRQHPDIRLLLDVDTIEFLRTQCCRLMRSDIVITSLIAREHSIAVFYVHSIMRLAQKS
jgi:hypothetical protein